MVKIITDTTACLPIEVIKRYNITVIPQIISFGEVSYYEGTQIDIPTFMGRLNTSPKLPTTAAPPPELFVQVFRYLVPLKEPILCIHPSAEVSGTVRSATVAAMDFPGADIRVMDTRVLASPMGTMVQLASKWAYADESIETIIKRLQGLIQRCRVYFLVDTLEYLARGGRIGGATSLLGSMLRIKPILTVRDGKVDQYGRERTHKRAVARLREIVIEQAPHDGSAHLSVMHAGVPTKAKALADELGPLINQSHVPFADLPPAIVTHGGPGILAAGFFIKE